MVIGNDFVDRYDVRSVFAQHRDRPTDHVEDTLSGHRQIADSQQLLSLYHYFKTMTLYCLDDVVT